MEKTPEERGAEWLKSGNTGASSKTVYNFFISGPPNDPHYPHDAADFGRCAALLEAVPEWESRLPELAAIGGMEGEIWAALADTWQTLSARYYAEEHDDLTKRIKEIIEPIEKASGRVVKIGKNAKMTLPKSAVESVQPTTLAEVLKIIADGNPQGYSIKDMIQAAASAESSDEDLLQAARYIAASTKPSTSALQRHLGIGYNRAARLMEMLEAEGSVTAPDDKGQREVSDKLKKAYGITQKIDEIAKATGTTPEKVFSTAKNMIGHNSGDDGTQEIGGVAGKRLKAFLDRIERLEEEKSGIAADIKDLYAEAKGAGFDTKTMRKLFRLQKMNTDKRREEEELLELYKAAVGMD